MSAGGMHRGSQLLRRRLEENAARDGHEQPLEPAGGDLVGPVGVEVEERHRRHHAEWRAARGCAPRPGPARAGHAAACPPTPRCGPGGPADVLADLGGQVAPFLQPDHRQTWPPDAQLSSRCANPASAGNTATFFSVARSSSSDASSTARRGADIRRGRVPVTQLVEQLQLRGFRCSVTSSLTHPLADHLVVRELCPVQLLVPPAHG